MEEKLTRLEGVPVDKMYYSRLSGVLTEHCAVVTRTGSKRYPPTGPSRTMYYLTIDFPEGTTREYTTDTQGAKPFTITFPDGYQMHGADLCTKGEPITVIHIPKEGASD